MSNESSNLPKEIDSNIIKEVLKQIEGTDELITSVPDNTKLNIEKLAEIETKLTNDQKLKLNNMVSEENLTAVSGGKINISPKTKKVLKKVGKGAFYLGGSALLLAGVVFCGKKGIAAWEQRNKPITIEELNNPETKLVSTATDPYTGQITYNFKIKNE